MNAIELIKKERISQIEKHGYDLDHDFITNSDEQLSVAAQLLLNNHDRRFECSPEGWDENLWLKMAEKTYRERLIIAGALIAAELDRINH